MLRICRSSNAFAKASEGGQLARAHSWATPWATLPDDDDGWANTCCAKILRVIEGDPA
jgi:hypothetical protein